MNLDTWLLFSAAALVVIATASVMTARPIARVFIAATKPLRGAGTSKASRLTVFSRGDPDSLIHPTWR